VRDAFSKLDKHTRDVVPEKDAYIFIIERLKSISPASARAFQIEAIIIKKNYGYFLISAIVIATRCSETRVRNSHMKISASDDGNTFFHRSEVDVARSVRRKCLGDDDPSVAT